MPTAIRLVFCLFMLIVCLALSISIIQLWLSLKYHLFSHEYIAQVTKNHVGEKPEQAFAGIIKDLEDEYPGHILPQTDRQWIFMNCGGWMGSMKLLHASLTEYVLIFGTAIHSSGNSGRYWANISDTILNGTFRQWKEGEIESQMFYPGDTVYHDIGEAAAVDWTPGTWMVEYGRGFVPSTLGFALADTFFSTQDFVTLYYVLRVYCKALILEATTSIVDLIT